MVNLEENSTIISETTKLVKDISSLFLSEKFSDVTLILDNERFFAHKVILAARSSYFADLLYDGKQEIEQSELTISLDTSPDAFRSVLQFLYTGSITISPSDFDPTLDLTSLAHRCSLTDFEYAIANQIKSVLSLKNICSTLNTANLYELVEIRDACHSFADRHALEIIDKDCFQGLSQKSLIKVLERDTFFAPELEIFKRVAQWCQKNNDVDGLLVKCVRLSWLSVVEIVSIVWPSKLVDCEDLLQAIAEAVEVKPRKSKCRAKLLSGVNVATSEHKAVVTTGRRNIKELLSGNRNISLHADHDITTTEKNGITIKFGYPLVINHIHMMLWDGGVRFYQYYIEVSTDEKNWKMVVDYRQYACRSVQNLYFEKVITQYIRVVGTHNSAHNEFHLVFFEAYFKDEIPKIVNDIVCPITNVATKDKKAMVVEGVNGAALLDGITSNYGNYTHHVIGSGSIIVQLAQPFMLSSMKLLLWNNDSRFYKYYIEVSINKSEWTMIADHRNEENKSWQIIHFSERPIVFIRITGTGASAGTGNALHLLHFECPVSDEVPIYK
ncbi:hypothetical protein Zmor_026392 [Zophobas morio]|uniref:BTB domain-containing protein n=2 Tax=Zophobas morio TaxID=2755281 RepID=A0AA38HUB2_9CUCU|nr:hypothetical protein Zmor_026392 [Zophobas morio]